jgi:UDP-N-acetylglucosamine diphosphorylase / glucose-1-phosphate thymidylyltransferase / UDP-N-acetylgalactosamine diphosphorylase / glucosamine-1-phosphate N-acetyltransferase / galactosamine-1-phosphate N-acetyltransferase
VKVGLNSRIGAGAIISKDIKSNKIVLPKSSMILIDNDRTS